MKNRRRLLPPAPPAGGVSRAGKAPGFGGEGARPRPHVKPQRPRSIVSSQKDIPNILCYTLDKQIRRVYSSRRLERAGFGCLGASRPARHGNLFASRPDQPRSTRATRQTARSERRNFSTAGEERASRPPRARERQEREDEHR